MVPKSSARPACPKQSTDARTDPESKMNSLFMGLVMLLCKNNISCKKNDVILTRQFPARCRQEIRGDSRLRGTRGRHSLLVGRLAICGGFEQVGLRNMNRKLSEPDDRLAGKVFVKQQLHRATRLPILAANSYAARKSSGSSS